MMKKLWAVLFILIGFLSCQDNDADAAIPENIEVEDFVWKGMNAFYYWQANVPNLADTRFASQQELNNFLFDYAGDPNALFQDLRYQPGVTDRFSVIVSDYVALENSLQGTNVTTGMEFGLVGITGSNDIFGYVRYVIPNSDAANKGVERGMLFTHVDGTQLTQSNYINLLFSSANSFTIELANFNGGNPIPNGTTISLIKSQITENPIHIRKTFDEGSHKIGYLLYNQFVSSFDVDLNDAFAQFQAEGITDLIVDLRYNGGGFVSSAIHFAGMITGQFTNQLMYKTDWNNKVNQALADRPNFFNVNFRNELQFLDENDNEISLGAINSLNLNRIYFITTFSSASASELLISSLQPYINVTTVGDTTRGKVHGSITLYDSDDLTREGPNFNTNHTWALQPLTFEYKNSNDQSDPMGIAPTMPLEEDYGNLGVLGERTDPLLDATLALIINGTITTSIVSSKSFGLKEISNSRLFTPASNNLYHDLKK